MGTSIRALLVLATTFACANGAADGDGAPAEAPVADSTIDTVAPQFTAIPLPDDFPPEFPIPPGAIPIAASTRRETGGTLAMVELVDRATPGETLVWYRQALADLGWSVHESDADSARGTLHAGRGESYVDLRMAYLPDDPTGSWLYIEGEVWSVAP